MKSRTEEFIYGTGFLHDGAVGFKKVGKILFEVVSILGVDNVGVLLPKSMLYNGENPFEIL